MMQLSERLEALGIVLPEVPAPVASYVPAVVENGLVYTSGQVAFVNGVLTATGLAGENGLDAPAVARLARQAALNALAAAAAAAGGLDRLAGVVKVTGFVASAPGFHDQALVLNGASDLFGELFGAAGAHARSAVGVAALPLNAPVEVEVIFELA